MKSTITAMSTENIIEACARAGYEAGRSCVLRTGLGNYMKSPWEDLSDKGKIYFRESVLHIASGNDYFEYEVHEDEDSDVFNELNEIFLNVVRATVKILAGVSLDRRRQLANIEFIKHKVAIF
jgi:hypothetical protein